MGERFDVQVHGGLHHHYHDPNSELYISTFFGNIYLIKEVVLR
jgi:hypothetical protein